MPNGRAKKGGEIGLNGEFYRGGLFLPSTEDRTKKFGSTKKQPSKPVKPLEEWQLKNLLRAISGTKAIIQNAQREGNQRAIDANEAYLELLDRKLKIDTDLKQQTN